LYKIIFKKLPVILVIIIGFSLLTVLNLSVSEIIEDSLIDLRFKLRGERHLSDNFLLVFIGSEDFHDLGGWPITRDYYVYMIYLLSEHGAKVTGLDLLFNRPNTRYPEFDDMLTSFTQAARNVCLPMAYIKINADSLEKKSNNLQSAKNPEESFKNIYRGMQPIFPFPQLKKYLAGLGFSNIEKESVVRKIPLVVTEDDSFRLSFGAELARLYLDVKPENVSFTPNGLILKKNDSLSIPIQLDNSARLRLNHFGDLHNVNSISFVDLFQIFRTNPDSIDLKNKLVFLAITAPGTPTLKATPLSPAVPASLIQLTVADNIIQQNFLAELSLFWKIVFISFLAVSIWFIWERWESYLIRIAGSLAVLFFYWLIVVLLFNVRSLILPLFYPSLAWVTTLTFEAIWFSFQRQKNQITQQTAFEIQIVNKQNQLHQAETRLIELQNKLQHESEERANLSAQSQQYLEEQQSEVQRLEKQLSDLQAYQAIPESAPPRFENFEIIHGPDSKMTMVLKLIQKVGFDDIPVLILGDTGTGKELVARAIHQCSQRKSKPFLAINCGALSETLLESELFGHEKGSFTGAQTRRRGRFELANGGTLFLDEITETSPSFQAKLLRVLQEGTFERLGSEQTLKVDVRIIAASNRNLKKSVDEETFRADLFYRLNGFPIQLPPLSERREDIPLLAVFFLEKYNYSSIKNFSGQVMLALTNYPWPGNVRELENVIRRAAILAQSEGRKMIRLIDLPEEIQQQSPEALTALHQPIEVQILDMLRRLQFSHTSISQTARALGNRDRGTITEYLRGICFQYLVEADFNVNLAAQRIAATDDENTVAQVLSKIERYLKKIRLIALDLNCQKPGWSRPEELQPKFKGLPKKYLPFLAKVIENIQQSS